MMAKLSKRKRGQQSSGGGPSWAELRDALECPVCIRVMMDPPVYSCENLHGLCLRCRTKLKEDCRPCPVCRGRLTDKRLHMVEKILEKLPLTRCKYDGCAFAKADADLVATHEAGECGQRLVPCPGQCSAKVTVARIPDHLLEQHGVTKTQMTKMIGGGETMHIAPRTMVCLNAWKFGFRKIYETIADGVGGSRTSFVLSCTPMEDGASAILWASVVGPRDAADRFLYSVQINKEDDGKKRMFFYGARDCVACDVDRRDVVDRRLGIVVDHDLVGRASVGADAARQLTRQVEITVTFRKPQPVIVPPIIAI